MVLDFKIFKLNENHSIWEMTKNKNNEFIVIGEMNDYYKVHQLEEESGLVLIKGLTLAQLALYVKKEDLTLDFDGISYETTQLDIPKEYLDLDTVEDILRLNN